MEPKYKLVETDLERVNKDFSFHPMKADQGQRYEAHRECAAGLARLFLMNCPPSRERSLAMTHLEDAMMWANAAIARNE